MEIRRNLMNEKIRNKHIDSLFDAVLLLRNSEECYMFFEDICTVSELNSLAQRLEVAKLLQENYKYNEITERTGASTATISRVSRCLNYGADGYRIILERLREKK
jgi:TrpR-related protein YerC/YecD